MSLGSISRPKRFSDAQFVGDLTGLFKRHRIDSGDAGSVASFELCFASKDSFRSQLFTLCTAISHMSQDDLTGEQLLVLIARALGLPEAADGSVDLPDSMRTAFLNGFGAWCNRDLNEPATWPPSREPASNQPIPFRQAAESDAAERRTPDMNAPGMRTVQEALLMARKQTPFELPARTGANPAPSQASSAAAAAGVNIEELTITELTRLLDDIERRMSRIKPQLNAQSRPPEEAFERPTRSREVVEAPPARVAAVAQRGPSLVHGPAPVALTAIEPAGIYTPPAAAYAETARAEDDPFLARHVYLKPGRRLPPDTIVPLPLATPPPASVELPKAELPSKTADILMALMTDRPERFRVKMQLAVGVAAVLILVASPMAGFVAYKLLHPTYVIEYQDVRPAATSSGDAVVPAPSQNADPPAAAPQASRAGSPAQKVANPKGAVPAGTKASRNPHPVKPAPPAAAVWPPPPQR